MHLLEPERAIPRGLRQLPTPMPPRYPETHFRANVIGHRTWSPAFGVRVAQAGPCGADLAIPHHIIGSRPTRTEHFVRSVDKKRTGNIVRLVYWEQHRSEERNDGRNRVAATKDRLH